ncbi:MAG: DUF126 domain-containing protein [Chloroflexota bacterium]
MADVIQGRKIVGGRVRGEALVSHEDICFLNVDTSAGVITEQGHELEGVSFAGKIIVFPTGKGSTGGSYALYDLGRHQAAPAGIINLRAEPVTAIGAIMANIPMIDRAGDDPTAAIRTGDHVELDADRGTAVITRRDGG